MEKIRIGEIKCEALRLVFPELDLHFDTESDESINDTIANLKCDPTIRGYLDSCVPAINRAITIIESRGAGKSAIKTVSLKNQAIRQGKARLLLNGELSDVHSVVAVYQNGMAVDFITESDNAVLVEASDGEVEIVYKAKIPRISEKTSDADVIDLDRVALEAIPYYVRGELLLGEDSKGAKEAKQSFFDILNSSPSKPLCQGQIMTVYSI